MIIPILTETTEYLIINKPAGISVHGDGKVDVYTLTDWILERYPELASVGEPMELGGRIVLRPGIVHRIDKETSGCLLIAKTQDAFLHFKNQFQEHTVEKIYHTFVYGVIKEKKGIIDLPIGRSKGDVRKWTIGGGARGLMREAITEYSVMGSIGTEDGKGSTESSTFSFVECRPKTGRTHQIRVHMKSLNHPIVCDSLYAPKRDAALGFSRLALHARTISFHDTSGTPVSVTAPYPEDFEKAVKNLERDTSL